MKYKKCLMAMGIFCILAFMFFSCIQTECTEIEKHYCNLAMAEEAGEIQRGWLPGFLPKTTHNIQLKYDYENNCLVATFCLLTNDQSMIVLLEPVAANIMHGHWPNWQNNNAKWFPDWIVNGQYQKAEENGFGIYAAGLHELHIPTKRNPTWYFAINKATGKVFMWQ